MTNELQGNTPDAPALKLPTADGREIDLASFRGKPVLLSFLNHAACPFCRVHLVRMIGERDRIARLGAEVLLVAFDEPSLLAAKLLFEIKVPFELLLDQTKQTYHRWGMGRTNIIKTVLSPTLGYRHLKLLLNGQRFLGVAPDMSQLGGDFVIDKAGRITFAHLMRNNGDRLDINILLNELDRVAET